MRRSTHAWQAWVVNGPRVCSQNPGCTPVTWNFLSNCCVADDTGKQALLVFADDWGRHPSSCQHLVRQWLDRYAVTWVNTIGTRTPRLDLATLKRGGEKIVQWLRPKKKATAAVTDVRVLNPRM